MISRPVKRAADSALNNQLYIIFPHDLNPNGTVFGGTVMAQADKVAGLVAMRHSGQICVTAFVESFRFLAPARRGEVLVFYASLNRVWHSSMEVGVKVFADNCVTGERRQVVSAYYTFVPIDENHRPARANYGLLPETEEEKRRYQEAEKRRLRRHSSL